MKKRDLVLIICVVLVTGSLFIVSCKKSDKDAPEQVDCSKINASFSADIKPIISDNCLSAGCHNANSSNGDFTQYTGIKAKVDNGSFKSRVVSQKNMPPSGSLSNDNLKKINCWLNSGALDN